MTGRQAPATSPVCSGRTGTSRQPSRRWPSATHGPLAAAPRGARARVVVGRQEAHQHAVGAQPAAARSRRRARSSSSGICIRIPAPSPVQRVGAGGAAVLEVLQRRDRPRDDLVRGLRCPGARPCPRRTRRARSGGRRVRRPLAAAWCAKSWKCSLGAVHPARTLPARAGRAPEAEPESVAAERAVNQPPRAKVQRRRLVAAAASAAQLRLTPAGAGAPAASSGSSRSVSLSPQEHSPRAPGTGQAQAAVGVLADGEAPRARARDAPRQPLFELGRSAAV